MYLRQENMDAFQHIYDRLLKQYPKDHYAASAVRLKGKEFELQGKYNTALKEFNKFLKSYPKDQLLPDVLWHAGWCNYQFQEYQAALKTFDRLVRSYPKAHHKDEALYWAARAAEKLQQVSNAATYYLKIVKANQNSYFGVLAQQALARLKQAHPNVTIEQSANDKKPLPLNKKAAFSTKGGILHQQKSHTLAEIGLYSLAAEEFAYAIEKDKEDHAKYLELARLYHRADRYHDLARLMRKHFWYWIAQGDENVPRTFWEYAYPLSFRRIVDLCASVNGLDPLLVQALMLKESVFDPHAIAAAGEMGLMQLLPATGKKMANRLGISIYSPDEYFRPDVNILLGTTYLNELSQLFRNQLPPVIASYNAGEHRVSTWWQENYKDDIPAFVAMIPYDGTKNYVQAVLWYYREYRRIYKGS